MEFQLLPSKNCFRTQRAKRAVTRGDASLGEIEVPRTLSPWFQKLKMEKNSDKAQNGKPRRRRRPARPRFQMRVSTKYAPRKPVEGKPLSCTTETSLKPEQLLELYRYLKLTRLVEERLVNLYRQTKVVGGVFRSLGQEATAVGSAYALQPQDFVTPLIRDLGAVLVKGIQPRDICVSGTGTKRCKS